MHPALIKAIAAEHIRDLQAEAASRRRAGQFRRRGGGSGTHGWSSHSQAGGAPAPRLRSA